MQRVCPLCEATAAGAATTCGTCAQPLLVDGRLTVVRVLRRSLAHRTFEATGTDGKRYLLEVVDVSTVDGDAARARQKARLDVLTELVHPGLPRVYEHFTAGDGARRRLFVLRDYIEGETLAERIAAKKPLDDHGARTVLEGVLDILAGRTAVSPLAVAGPIEPGTILLRPNGRVALVGFDVERIFGATGSGPTPTGDDGDAGLRPLVACVVAAVASRSIHDIEAGSPRVPADLPVSPATRAALASVLDAPQGQTPASVADVRQALRASTELRSAPGRRVRIGIATAAAALVAAVIGIGLAMSRPDAEALHAAMRAGDATTALALLEGGADPTAKDANGRTPLHVAIGAGLPDVVERLLAAGADPGVPDPKGGATPLTSAVRRGCHGCISALLAKGADPNLNDAGLTVPIAIANEAGDAEAVYLLLKGGSRLWKLEDRPLVVRASARIACDGGEVSACTRLGHILMTQPPSEGPGAQGSLHGEPDAKQAREVTTKACEAADGEGCFLLAELWATGRGGGRDPDVAAGFYERACERLRAACGAGDDCAAIPACVHAACDDGDGAACNVLGERWANRASVDRDLPRARSLFERACDAGSAAGCASLGAIFDSGEGFNSEPERARVHYETACEGGMVTACTRLAEMWAIGRGGAMDAEKAAALLRRACDGGDATACEQRSCDGGDGQTCRRLAQRWSKGDTGARDDERARALLEKSCAASDPRGCFELGFFRINALGGLQDLDGGRDAFTRACKAGNPDACAYDAVLLTRGTPKDEDGARARDLLRRACDGGTSTACNNLGELLYSGKGGERDVARAMSLFESSCETMQDARACLRVALLTQVAADDGEDLTRAIGLLDVACTAGAAEACVRFGVYLEQGLGIERDSRRAQQLFSLACDTGHADACQRAGREAPAPRQAADGVFRLYRHACDNGNVKGCMTLGQLTRSGEARYIDIGEALVAFTRACSAGDAEGCRQKQRTARAAGI